MTAKHCFLTGSWKRVCAILVEIQLKGEMMKKFLALIALSLVSVNALAASEGCTVNQVVGQVQVMREGQLTDVSAKDILKKGDVIQTGGNCMADMSMNDLAGCRLLADSRVKIDGWKTENMALSVEKGNVILNLEKLPEKSSFKVETPTAVAVVRGTQFWGRVDDKNPDNPVTTIAVREGVVEITDKASSQTFSVEKGKALDISKDASSAPVIREALPEEMQAMEQANVISCRAV